MSRRFLQLVLGIMVLAAPCATADAPPSPPATQFRRPVALVLADDGKLLLVANQRSGSISVLDTAGVRVLGEANVGRRLADLAATPDGRLVAVDEAVGEL